MSTDTGAEPYENYIEKIDTGFYKIALYSGTYQLLPYLLAPELPYVWITNHSPKSYGWWKTQLPLSSHTPLRTVLARGIQFDLLLSYQEFMDWLEDFAEFGFILYQTVKPVPDSLRLESIAERSQIRVLVQNGVKTGFILPHPEEVAVFWSSELSIIRRALSFPQVRDIAIRQ